MKALVTRRRFVDGLSDGDGRQKHSKSLNSWRSLAILQEWLTRTILTVWALLDPLNIVTAMAICEDTGRSHLN